MLTGKYLLVLMMCVRAGSDGSDLKCVEIQLADPMPLLACKKLEAQAIEFEDILDEDINCIEARLSVRK